MSNTKSPGFFTIVQNDNMKQNAPHFVILSACEVSRSLNCQPTADRILSLRVKRGNPGHQMPSAPPTHLYHLDSSLSFKMTPSPSCCAIHPSLHHPKNFTIFRVPIGGELSRISIPLLWRGGTNAVGGEGQQNTLCFVILSACEVSRSLNCQPPADRILSYWANEPCERKAKYPGYQMPSAPPTHLYYLDSSLSFRMTIWNKMPKRAFLFLNMNIHLWKWKMNFMFRQLFIQCLAHVAHGCKIICILCPIPHSQHNRTVT